MTTAHALVEEESALDFFNANAEPWAWLENAAYALGMERRYEVKGGDSGRRLVWRKEWPVRHEYAWFLLLRYDEGDKPPMSVGFRLESSHEDGDIIGGTKPIYDLQTLNAGVAELDALRAEADDKHIADIYDAASAAGFKVWSVP